MIPTEIEIRNYRNYLQSEIDKAHNDCILFQLMLDISQHRIVLVQERSRLTHLSHLNKFQQMRLHHCRALIDGIYDNYLTYPHAHDYEKFNSKALDVKWHLQEAIRKCHFNKFLLAAFNNHVYDETQIDPKDIAIADKINTDSINTSKEELFVKDCPHYATCPKNCEHTCVGCNTWTANYHIEKLDDTTFNNMFDAFCLGSKDTERVKSGDLCLHDPRAICHVGCQNFKYAKKLASRQSHEVF